MLEFWSLVHSGTVALGSAKNDVSRWSRGLGRRYFYSPRRGGILTKQRTPLSSTPSNTMPHSGTNQQVRFCRPPPPYHRVASSRSVRVPRAFHKRKYLVFGLTCQFVTLHRATTTRRLEATTPEKGSPTLTRTAMARRTTRTTTARRTSRTAAGLAPTPRPPAT